MNAFGNCEGDHVLRAIVTAYLARVAREKLDLMTACTGAEA